MKQITWIATDVVRVADCFYFLNKLKDKCSVSVKNVNVDQRYKTSLSKEEINNTEISKIIKTIDDKEEYGFVIKIELFINGFRSNLEFAKQAKYSNALASFSVYGNDEDVIKVLKEIQSGMNITPMRKRKS